MENALSSDWAEMISCISAGDNYNDLIGREEMLDKYRVATEAIRGSAIPVMCGVLLRKGIGRGRVS